MAQYASFSSKNPLVRARLLRALMNNIRRKKQMPPDNGGGGEQPTLPAPLPPSDVKQTIFDQSTMTFTGSNEPGTALNVGVVFYATTKGEVRAVSFYKTAADVATSRQVTIYDMDGTVLRTGNSSSEPAGPGWVSVALSAPLVVEAEQALVAGVHFPQGAYPAQAAVHTSVVRRGFVLAESSAASGPGGNGRYKYGASPSFPDTTASGMSFSVDVEFYQGAHPSPATTGPTGTLTPMTGMVALWDGGSTIVENADIDGFVLIQAENCIVRNCRIRNTDGGVAGVIRTDTGMTTGVGLLVENCEIDGTGVTVNGIAAEGTFRKNLIHGVDNGFNLYGPCTITDNYVYLKNGTGDAHFDGIENNGASDVIIKHNTLITDVTQTSAVMLNNYANSLANIDVIDNYLQGGAYTLYVDNTKSAAVVDKDTIRILYNRMVEGDFGYFSLYTSAVLPVYNYDAVTGAAITI